MGKQKVFPRVATDLIYKPVQLAPVYTTLLILVGTPPG